MADREQQWEQLSEWAEQRMQLPVRSMSARRGKDAALTAALWSLTAMPAPQ
ncbi:hypothetical protein [Rhodococcus sp. ACT016]|uniref:hypothetical protein n=1 Tax=Rhodococcus sp. ACT016 TaxID=3134808 RepID=UPI003D2DBB5F